MYNDGSCRFELVQASLQDVTTSSPVSRPNTLPRYLNSLQYTFRPVSNISKSPTGNAAMRAILAFCHTFSSMCYTMGSRSQCECDNDCDDDGILFWHVYTTGVASPRLLSGFCLHNNGLPTVTWNGELY